MENEYTEPQVAIEKTEKWYTPLTTVTTISKVLAAIVFISMPFIGFWYGVQYEKDVETQTEYVVYTQKKTSDMKEIVPEDVMEWHTYTNTQYGFELQLPPNWKDVQIGYDPSNNEINKSIIFSLKRDSGEYSKVFTITIIAKNEWDRAIREDDLFPYEKIGERDSYVFGVALGNEDIGFSGYPEPVENEIYHGPYYEVKTLIIPTFKFTDFAPHSL